MKSFKSFLNEAPQFGGSDPKPMKKYHKPGLKGLRDLLIPKKWTHKFKRAIHDKKYKDALNLYHSMIQQYNKNPSAQSQDGGVVMNPKGLALSKAASMVGISVKELKKVLDKKTRYEEMDLFEQITKADLNDVERFADKIFAKVGIDVEFTRHFLDRVNDKRNGKEINVAELTRLFKQTYKKHGKKIAKMGDDAEAVLNDLQTNINVPFVLQWDGKEFDLISKTIMRKKDFKTNDTKLKV